MAAILARCPIRRHAARLEADGTLTEALRAGLERDVADAVADALRYAESAPFPDVADALRDVV
jgi:TPP-dependent pyruvate/acetoin dehydrogenase alpha subunit